MPVYEEVGRYESNHCIRCGGDASDDSMCWGLFDWPESLRFMTPHFRNVDEWWGWDSAVYFAGTGRRLPRKRKYYWKNMQRVGPPPDALVEGEKVRKGITP